MGHQRLAEALRRAGHTVIEYYILSLYVYGHGFLLQLFVIPLGGIDHTASYQIFKIIPIVYFSWAAVSFCRGAVWKTLALSLVAHLRYLAVLITVGLTTAAAHDLIW